MMGILNTTPDSFSDGGEAVTLDLALTKADMLIASGAQILDLGGESTRPGAPCVPEDEEIARLLPVVRAIRAKYPQQWISIDTRKSKVAEAMLREGVQMINDVSGGVFDPRILEVTAQYGAYYVLMHSRATPENMQQYCDYDDLFEDVACFFEEQIQRATQAGIAPEKIILDIGLGFAKTAEQCLEIVENYAWFLNKFPQNYHLIGHSRKSFLRLICGDVPPIERDIATSEITQKMSELSPKLIFRVHKIM